MGLFISSLKNKLELLAKNNTLGLRVGGFFITFILVLVSGYLGWLIERISFSEITVVKSIGLIILVFSLSSAIAYKSLRKSVKSIIDSLNEVSSEKNIKDARKKLRNIVGRDVNHLSKKEILRATAESASENSVDGIFAPIFWMFVGIILWKFSTNLPGPLALSWSFKATSTIDSMLGYKKGNLFWIGYFGAKLDDFLTWVPCRLVLITLPLISQRWYLAPKLIKKSLTEGSKDESPNSGISEAIFANCFQIRMGGENKYDGVIIKKSILAAEAPEANEYSINKLIDSIFLLEILWTGFMVVINSF
tara:strand:+ start:799 stop:1716 length:918 start_codon:yes stop_codon:yes gene_type:complete